MTAMFYCLVMSCLTPPDDQHDLVPAQDIDLDYHPVKENVDKFRRSTPEIISGDGYAVDIHHVATEDGYVLEMVRIKGDSRSEGVKPVLFVHGLVCTSAIWVWAGKEMSMPYKMADLGIEVWLGTFRGGRGSDGHVTLGVDSDEYWDFGYDHVAQYDIPAMISYVLGTSVQDKINYIGHSMGGSTYFAMCNYKPDICKERVNLMVGLGTHTVLHNVMSPAVRYLADKYGGLLGGFWFKDKFGKREFNPSPDIMRDLAALFCTTSLHAAGLCRMGIFLLVGPNDLNITRNTLGYLMEGVPSTASVMLMEHYLQFVDRRQWAKFDYGMVQNMHQYGSIAPPLYSLEHVTTPVALFTSDWDMFCSYMDTKTMSLEMPYLVYEKNMNRTWYNHGDFFYNADNVELNSIVTQLVQYEYTVQNMEN